jgi:hypothetical protein
LLTGGSPREAAFPNPQLMLQQKVVTPVKTGVQEIHNDLKRLDSGFRRNDGKPHLRTFDEAIKVQNLNSKSGNTQSPRIKGEANQDDSSVH